MSGRYEDLDPRPVEWPLNLKRPLSIQEEIKRFVRAELSQRAQEQGFESFEEADDFDVEDDDDWSSPYELTEMQEEKVPSLPSKEAPEGPAAGSPGEPAGAKTELKPAAAGGIPAAAQQNAPQDGAQ